MEQELCHLVKLFIGQEHLLPFEPKADGNKKEHFLYLLLNRPFESKSFYKGTLYEEGYRGTGYEVLRNQVSEDILLSFSSYKKVCSGSSDNVHVSLISQVYGLRVALYRFGGSEHHFIKIISHLLRKCEKYSLRLEQSKLTRLLVAMYGVKEDQGGLMKYKEKLLELRKMEVVDDLLGISQAELHAGIGHHKDCDRKTLSKFEGRIKEVSLAMCELKNADATMEYHLIRQKMVLAEVKKDFNGLLSYAQDAWQILRSAPIKGSGHVMIYLALAHAGLGNYIESEQRVKQAKTLLNKESLGYLQLLQVSFSSKMFQEDYSSAFEELRCICETRAFKTLSEDLIEIYVVFFAYIKLAIRLKVWITDTSVQALKDLERKDLNKIKLRSHKLGVNIGLIVLKFCEELDDDNFEALISMDESLKRYISRNLKMHDTRPSIFLKMLLMVIQLDFNSTEIEKKTKRLYLKLQEPSPGVNTEGNEIIRYEILWEWILKKLKESSLLPKPKS